MKVNRIPFYLSSRSEIIEIIGLGDIHHLKANHCERELMKALKYIEETPNCYVIDVGDSCDFIATSDKRFQASGLPDKILQGTPKEIKERLEDIYRYSISSLCDVLEPIKDRILCAVYGNHESKVLRMHHYNAHQDKCDRLGIFNGGLSCFLNFSFQREINGKATGSTALLRAFVKHIPPGGTGRTPGAKYNALGKMVDLKEVDLIWTGHTHGACYEHFRRETTSSGKTPRMVYHDIYAINTGSFTETLREGVETYEEERGYRSNPITLHKVIITPFTKRGPEIDIVPWHIR